MSRDPSSTHDERESFFIGFQSPDRPTSLFLAVLAVLLIAGSALFGWALAAVQDDPGAGGFRWDMGAQSVTGVLETGPYPILHVTESAVFEPGHTLLLSGQGKQGVMPQADGLDGAPVNVSGFVIKRGSIDMLQVNGGDDGLVALEDGAEADLPEPVPLGRWRITGEICDGKCTAGAMRPGQGLAHKACANLCITGGVPAIFVTTDEIDGESFLLIAGPDGGPPGEWILDHTATLVEIEGLVTRRGGILVFAIDPATIHLAGTS